MARECCNFEEEDEGRLPDLSHQELCGECYDANEDDDITYDYDYDYDDESSSWSPDWEHKLLPPEICYELPDAMHSFAPRICSH